MRVERFLEQSARRYPDKRAVVTSEASVSYAQLDRDAQRLASGLRARGVARGDRVVIFLDNSVEAVASIFAVLKTGAVFCVVNPSTKAEKLAYILGNCRASALVTEQRLLPVAAPAVLQANCVSLGVLVRAEDAEPPWVDYDALLREAPGQGMAEPGIDIDLAMIVYTSGSTGFPKGVMMTHQNVAAAAGAITDYLNYVPDDVVLSVLPLAFDYGLYQALMCAKTGATLVLERSFAFPALILEKLRDERVTGFPLVPTMAAMLLQMRSLVPGMFPALRYITNTGAALPPAHILRLQGLFPGTEIFSMYGMTECKRCTYLPPAQLAHRPDSVGIAIPGTEAYVVDDAGVRTAPGMVGELVIRGAHVFKGYWENEEATAKALRPGPYPWERVLYTGDLFRTDEEGYLYFVGRKDDIIKSRGEKVSPKEIENVLYALPGVSRAAVFGVPDPLLGMAIKAVIEVEPGSGLDERQILAHCRMHLEDFMVPKIVEFRHDLPTTDTGKIQRRELQAEAPSAGTVGRAVLSDV